jgi:amino acid adenylation domain-containing protein/non-ribosomal peptide synthase protein (TIGR01720 family)
LGEIENRLLNHPEIKEAVVIDREDQVGNKFLCAYVVRDSSNLPEFVKIKEFLSEGLPDYMLPLHYIPLDKIPLTPNGKVDRKHLPEPELIDLRNSAAYIVPGNIIEKKLVETWQEVLGKAPVSINDNFFEIGGDSIKTIQIISRMRKAGYKLEMRDIFQNPQISALAPIVKKIERKADQSVITGTVPLTPIQKDFFENQLTDKHHYNQAVMLMLEEGFDQEAVKTIFTKIQEHHDALRMTYKEEKGKIIQTNHGLEYPLSLNVYDLRNQEYAGTILEQKANELQSSINLETGPLMKLGLFHLQDGHRLLIAIHHLVIDGISWRILFEDMAELYQQYKREEKLVLPLKADSFKVWAEKLKDYANSDLFLKEKTYWAQLESELIPVIRKDFETEDNYIKNVGKLSFTLNGEETHLLLTKVNEAFGTEINDILLTALGLAVKRVYGNDRLLIALEGHGREEILGDIDVSRTVGWFTSLYPLLLDFSYESADAHDRNLSRQIKEVKEMLRQMPHKGVGYGILKYLTSETHKKEINFRLNPQIIFNYMGQFDEDLEHPSFKIAPESTGDTRKKNQQREFEVEVSGMITGKRLVMSITYNSTQYEAETIEELLAHFKNALSQIISYCSGRDLRELTPSDFTYSQLSIEALEQLQEQFSYKIEDIYTLSPLQEGMLFHSLYDRHSLAYFEQISYRLKGELDEVVFKKSLKKLIRRYDILRTVFVHEELECPLQIVLKYPRLDFIFEDVRKIAVLGGNRLEKFIEEFKEKDKRRTFDLSKDALMRVSVIRVDEKEYELIWSFHHILIDGWCLGIMIAEYFEFYNSYLENRPPKLSPVKPYRTYIKWLEKHDKEESKEYWRAYLDTYEQLTTIPRLRVSNAGDGSEGEVAYQLRHMVLSLDEEKTNHLNKLAGRNNVTLNTIMQAMWGVILGRYNGKQDVVFGSVVSGRPSDIEGVESMVGLFLNTIPVRISYKGETTFNQLLRVVQRDALESEKHHHYPLAEIQSEHRLKQSLLDHIFVFENYPLAEQIDGMNVESNKSNFQISNTEVFEQTNYNLHINVSSGTSLRAIFCFNALVYEEPLMHTVLQHFKDLVRQIIENPGIEVRAIEKITAEQKQETLLQLNRELPEEAAKFEEENHAIQERLTKNFAKYSANIAIEQGNKKVTYGELDEKSNFIAHWIVNMGLPKETFIGVLINDKVDLIITMIGILKAGCVFIPLDSAHPLDRVKIMVDSTDTKVVISDGINFNQFAPGIMGNSNEKKVKLFLIEELFSPGHAPWYVMPPKIEYCPEDKIYIYFTSGTTGHPKAIVGKNKGLFHFIDWEIETMQVDETFRISQFTTPGFDAFLRDILLPLCTGGVICIPERKETLMAAHQLVGWIERTGINLIHCVPALFRSINSISLTENNFVTLKYILLSGEKSEPVDFVYWFEIFNDRIKLVNLWGTSETTLAKTCYFVRPSDVNRVRMPVGHPINGCRVVVLDENLRLCDELITGELYIATPFRSFGYYNDPRMNQDRFIKNPFNTNPDDVLHKTGDLGRLLPGGNIDVLGRNDRQVKIRGIRIELEGIENVLVRHPWVNEAVVIKKEKSDNNEFLCAYVTGKETNPTEDADVVIPDLKQYLSGQLPDYMIPANIQKMKEIPRTPNGKVDYKKLPDPFEYKKTGIIGPNNSIEEKILDYWSEILGIEKNKIGITNLFFELGGNSLNIMSLISKIHREFSIRISLAEIFNNPTIEMQAKIIKGAAGENKYASIEKTELKEYYALSPAQNRLYILHQMEPDSVAYNMPQMVVLEGKLAKDRLEQSFWKLIKRHQSLRSSFKMINDEPVQKIHVEVELKSEYYQSLGKEEERSLIICEQSQVDVEVKVNEIINNFIRPFDLSHAPLLRVGLINTPRPKGHPSQEGNYNNRHILMFDLHHIISDGVSHSILIKDFMALYKREETSPLRIHYKDFSEWRNKEDQKNALEEQKKYWLREFEGEIPVLNIHTDYPRPSVQSFEGNRINFEIDEEKTKALNNLAAAQGTTLYTVLLAAFNLLLAKISGQEDIVIGTPVAGRRHADLEEIIGMFVNTLALRSYPKGEGIFINFLQHVKKNTLEAFENQEYPFEDIVEHVSVNRDVSRNPLFDVMLVLQNMDFPKVKIPGLELFPYQYKKRISKFDLTLHSTEAGEKLLLAFEYCTKLFKKETIERFIAYFRKIVTSILIEPRIKISDIEIIPGQEKKKILLDFNDTDAEYPQNKTIHELFAEQVKRTPDHIALVGQSEDERSALCAMRCALTYKELNEISNHLAHLLQTKNVKPDTIVGIMVERSIEMIIGILGILKAGGAYLPIDPEYPEERINYMSADSRAKFLVTTPDLVEKYRKLSIVNCQLLMVNEEFPDHSINNYQFTIHNSQLNSSRLAYVIYTSGSTGKPKGVMVQHRSVVNRLNWMQRMYPIEPRDVILQKTTFTFDVSVWELFWWSFQGASVCLLGHGDEKSPGAIIEAIEIDKVTTIHFVPSMLNSFLEYLENLENSNGLSTLRHVFASGEALSVHHVETFNRLLKQKNEVKLINLYGPTEATVDVSYFNCPVGKKVDNIPIGKPIDNIRLYIVDRWHHLQPVGVSGELCIAGLGLARGYLNNPELTKEKFQIPNPITPMPHYPIYMTGDLARWLPDGNIEFIGRIDHQVKIRGFRIELGEIECHLLNDNEIKEAVVAAEEDKNGTICLCAYIVSGKEFTVSHLRSYLAGRLPDYMLPSFFIPVDKIPLTASGKVDRKRLPEPQSMDLRSGGAYIAPRSLIEKKLTQIWQKVLGIRTVSINDNFFEIGGDSIKTIQIISQIRKVGYKLEMSDIFRYPRISDLTTFVKKVERIADQSVITGTVPLTPIQKRFFENQIIDNHHYNQAVMFVLEEGFDQEAVKAVFTKIQAHHDALRMTYRENNGEIIQVNRGLEHPLSLQVFDYRNREDARSLLEGKANEIQASINLETGPLMRLGLFHLDDGHRLLIVTHHLVIDGVSWRILFEDIETLYRQYKKDKPLTLPLKTDAFKLWSEKLSDYANSDLFLKEKMYWAELESKQIQKIKKDFEEEDNYMKDVESLSFSLQEIETHLLLTKVNEAFGTEINDILLTALGFAVKKICGNDRLLIALEGHGREEILNDVDVSRTMGWFTTLYPIILDFSHGEKELSLQIKEVKENLRKLLNKGIGYGILKYLTRKEHKEEIDFRLNPQVIFNYLGQFDEDLGHRSFRIAKESVGYNHSQNERRGVDLEVSGIITNKRLIMSVSYNRKQYKQETITELLEYFKRELVHIITYCSSRQEKELTPSDLTYPELSIETLDQLQRQYSHLIEDIYTLTPMQEGMLFYALFENEARATYFEQMSYRLQGELNVPLVEKSLNELFKRHDVLRTVFIYEGLNRPIQVVLKERNVDFYFEDLRESLPTPEKKEIFIREFLDKDRQRSFDLSKDVLMRVAVLQLADAEYQVTWSSHHILMDGWCIGILISEFFQVYTGYLETRTFQLPAIKPYRTYIQWLEKQEKNKTRNYWKKYLEGYEEIAAVPKKKDAGIFAGGYNAAAASTRFEEEKTIALNKVAIRNHVTLNTVLQVAWGIVLGKYCSKQDIVYGVLISGRPPEIEGVESMIGCFINTIPVRITFDGKTKLNELIRNVQDRAIESEPHYYYSLAEIQAESALKQNLLDHIIEFQNYPPAERIEGVRDNIRKNKKTETLKLSNVNVREQSNYDFNIMIIPGNQVFLGFSYNANVYDSQLVAQLGLNSIRVLEQIIEDDKITIDEIAILSEEEKRKILFEFNNNTADFPRDKSIYRFVEKYAEMTADRIALVGKEEGGKGRKVEGKKDACAEAHLTYRELNERANRLAKVFRRRGIQTDEPVGILMQRSQAMVESILAAWKAGGAYMPIDPGYPGERIDHMLSDSRTKLLVTTRIFAREDRKPRNLKGKKAENRRKTTEDRKQWKVGSRKFNMIFLEDICNKTAVSSVAEHSPKAFKHCPKGSSSHLHLSPAPVTSLAYIIYTSGSTGKPKGVMIEHIGMMNHIQAKINDLQLTEKSIVAQNATHTFDISIWQFFSALITGGQTVIYPDELIMEPGKFLSRLKKDQITILEVVPSYLSVLLDDTTEQHNMPLSLQYLLVTGEEIKPHLVKKWFDMYPNIKMVNAYGPTEASDDITHYIMDKAPDMERIPIGKPLQNMNIYIVDNRMHLCPIGVKGEICVAGVGVGRGYIGDEEKTKQVFIKNPFVSPITNESSSSSTNDRSPYYPNSPLPQSPIYLTGDLGAWLPDGTILFFGRKDYQVKIRGFRIELGEIEDRLLNHPEIKEAVVIDREDNTGNKYLCAYIVVQHTAQGPWRMEPGEFLSQTLPAYMIPAHFMRLENIPLTSSGKVDRKALPEPEGGQITQKYMAPTNPVEEKLAEIWSEVLGKEKGAIGIHHNFFDLGGHSLKAIVLVSKVHKEFNVKLPLAELFKTPTIKELSHYIKEAAKDRYASIESAEKKDYYVLSSAQQRLYIIQQMDLDSNAYNLPGVFPLPEKSDLKKIEETFIQLIKRHESLRTSFHMVDAKPVQRVHDFQDVEFKIEYYELSSDNEGQNITDLVKGGSREEGKEGYFMASEHHLRRHFSSAFALSQPPLLKVGVVKTGQEKFLLVVVMHHIISDGISHTILVKDFTAIYNGKELPGLKLQYKDYAEWRLHPGQIEIIKKQENYWLKEFEKEIPVLNLPIDYERPEIQTIEGEMIDFVISKEETSALKHMASEDGATLHMILLALFNVFLSKVSDQEDIIIGTPAAGRRHADLDLIIGMFVNTLAFRNYPTREKTFKEFLKEVKERALQVFENQDFQFDDLVERVVRKRDINRNPIFDVMFMFQGRAEQNSSSPEVENTEPYTYGAVWDLSLVGAERGENLSLTFGYRTTLFKTGTIKKFIKHFKEILSAVIEKKEIKLKGIKISHELFDKKLEIPQEEGDFVF